MQIAARLLVTAAAAVANAVTGPASDAAATGTEPAADANTNFGALLAAALSPAEAAAGLAPQLTAGSEVGTEAGTDFASDRTATAADSSGLAAASSPPPDLTLQAMLAASQAMAAALPPMARPADTGALPAGASARTIDTSVATFTAVQPGAPGEEKLIDRPDASDTGSAAAQSPAASVALASEPATATRPAQATPAQPFSEVLRRHEREPEMPAAGSAATAYAPAATELPATQAVRHVSAPLSSARWEQALGEQVLWVARKELQTASLTLNPPELGPVHIELQLHDAQAIASFSSQQPEVRKAIEDALPSLKAMFADAGLQLQQANVGSGDAGRQASGQRQVDSGSDVSTHAVDDGPALAAAPLIRASNRLLDTFA